MTSIKAFCLAVLVSLSLQANLVSGHGRLIEPAARNAAWRYGFDIPPNYDDTGLNCGGVAWQWSKEANGRCGVCGDGYNLPQLHVYPGKYAKSVITKSYITGQTIEVKIDVTANHQGYFEFRLGKLQAVPVTQSKLTHLLKLNNGDTRWFLNSTNSMKVLVTIELKLPDDLSCDHCVLQWWWRSGNSWGCDDKCGVGHGPQESYANCADIRIQPSSSTDREGEVVAETEVTAQTTIAHTPVDTTVTETNSNDPAEISNVIPTTVAEGMTVETTFSTTQSTQNMSPITEEKLLARNVIVMGCHAIGSWEGNQELDKWCHDNCSRGYCPEQHCVCAYK